MGAFFMWDAYFCMGAYKFNVVAIIKMVPMFVVCIISIGAYYPDFTVLAICN